MVVDMLHRMNANMQSALAAFWSTFAALYIAGITFLPIPKDNVRFADTILGFLLGTAITTIITWYFGSAKSLHTEENSNESSETTV